jgi:long-subunit fatty acid transport protein
MQFTRSGTYDALSDDDQPYEGTAYGTVKNDPDLPLGIGAMQPVPVLAIASDLGGKIPKLRVAAGLYVPNAYPFRNMRNGYAFNGDFTVAPPPTRYDIVEQDAAVLLPSLALAYSITPELDLGVRLSWGFANLKSTVAIWADPDNYEENVKKDSYLTAEVSDGFVPAAGLGLTFRPTPRFELAAVWSSMAPVQAKGTAQSDLGPSAGGGVGETTIHPVDDSGARCAPGGTEQELKACVQLEIPMSATIGARYKLLDGTGALKGDVELNVGWENWGKQCDFIADPGCTSPGQYRVVVDAEPHLDGIPAPAFKDSVIEHGLKDTFFFRLGGSYHVPLGSAPGANRIILRGGIGYDTRAAKDGWLRADLDGAARITTTVGAAYRMKSFEINVGGGYIHEGKNTNSGTCNPTSTMQGCRGDGTENPIDERRGPDPTNPLVVPAAQAESPVNQGTIESSYVLLMLGVSTWF